MSTAHSPSMAPSSTPALAPQADAVPPLMNGDRLSRAEFERRYAAMPHVKKAELIEGVVYMPSPVRQKQHGGPDQDLATWLGTYRAATPGVDGGSNSTVRLDLDNEPQPDSLLFVQAGPDGRSRIGQDGYIEGPPDLIAEVAASSASYDLHDKLKAYRRNGVQEYIVWRTHEDAIDWFVLREGRYDRLAPDEKGVLRSEVFPGLWLDVPALLRRDLAAVLACLQRGIESEEHRAFVKRLAG